MSSRRAASSATFSERYPVTIANSRSCRAVRASSNESRVGKSFGGIPELFQWGRRSFLMYVLSRCLSAWLTTPYNSSIELNLLISSPFCLKGNFLFSTRRALALSPDQGPLIRSLMRSLSSPSPQSRCWSDDIMKRPRNDIETCRISPCPHFDHVDMTLRDIFRCCIIIFPVCEERCLTAHNFVFRPLP